MTIISQIYIVYSLIIKDLITASHFLFPFTHYQTVSGCFPVFIFSFKCCMRIQQSSKITSPGDFYTWHGLLLLPGRQLNWASDTTAFDKGSVIILIFQVTSFTVTFITYLYYSAYYCYIVLPSHFLFVVPYTLYYGVNLGSWPICDVLSSGFSLTVFTLFSYFFPLFLDRSAIYSQLEVETNPIEHARRLSAGSGANMNLCNYFDLLSYTSKWHNKTDDTQPVCLGT